MSRPLRSVRDRLLEGVEVDDNGCWLWQGYIRSDGYGQIGVRRDDGQWRMRAAHRVSYETFIGFLGDLDVDHLCKVRHCIKPHHMDAVTRHENTRRGDSTWAKQYREGRCENGHDLTLANALASAGNQKRCRECWNAYMRNYKKEMVNT